jgi:hypothetical protein
MSRIAAFACLAILMAGGPAAAQGGTDTPRNPAADAWIFSETQSPIDYTPVIIASAWSNADADDRAMQLSIQCRRGRTDLIIAGPALAAQPQRAQISYALDDGPPIVLAAGPAPSGTGIALRVDVVRLLRSLPAHGDVAFQVAVPKATLLEGRYALAAFNAALNRIAGPCQWPARPQ